MENKHLRTLTINNIQDGILREMLYKGLTKSAIDCIDRRLEIMDKQRVVLLRMKNELENENRT